MRGNSAIGAVLMFVGIASAALWSFVLVLVWLARGLGPQSTSGYWNWIVVLLIGMSLATFCAGWSLRHPNPKWTEVMIAIPGVAFVVAAGAAAFLFITLMLAS